MLQYLQIKRKTTDLLSAPNTEKFLKKEQWLPAGDIEYSCTLQALKKINPKMRFHGFLSGILVPLSRTEVLLVSDSIVSRRTVVGYSDWSFVNFSESNHGIRIKSSC